jgi:UDP-N-acetyl-D-mannosaminuronate dehydrogenase
MGHMVDVDTINSSCNYTTSYDLMMSMLSLSFILSSKAEQSAGVVDSDSKRIDPGNPTYDVCNTPKIVGGVTKACTALAQAYYAAAIDEVVPVSSTRVAEMAKLLEHCIHSR